MFRLQQVIDRFANSVARRINAAQRHRASAAVEGGYSRESVIQRFIDQLEWEPLFKGVEGVVARVAGRQGRYGHLTIRRDAEYRLEASLVGGEDAFPGTDGRVGSIDEGLEIEGEDERGFRISLPRVTVTTVLQHLQLDARTTTLGLTTSRFTRSSASGEAPSLMVDWLISGPEQMPGHLRATDRVHTEAYSRERRGFRFDSTEHRAATAPPPVGTRSQSTRDYFVLDLPNGQVRVCRVLKDLAPKWARPIAIEYVTSDNPPSADLRDGIVEALGFVFGRHILRVGTTTFSTDGHPVEEVAISPWGRDVIQVCTRVDMPSIPPLQRRKGEEVEEVLAAIVSDFLTLREEMNLSRAVWTLWIGQRMPATFDSPLYASALETLMHAWFKSKRSKSGGVYMPQKEFRKAFEVPLKDFATIAGGLRYGDRMTRKVDRANQMGVNERFELFFEELGMPYGDGELQVIRARNVVAHGGVSDKSKQDALFLGNGYRTLVNRVILTMIGYRGEYVDYSVMGHPARPLEQPLGYRGAERLTGGAPDSAIG